MHTSKDDYLINTLRFVSGKKETQIYGAILPKSLTSPKMKETKAYKTYLGFAAGATHPKKKPKFKKPASPKLTTVLVSIEEPMRKSKRVKRPAKKSTKSLARGVVIRETPEMPLSKKKEKVDVTRRKGIESLSQVALNEDAQYEEVQRKSMRDFHKTHPSGSGTVTKTALSAAKIKPSVTNEGTGVIPGVLDVTKEESSENENEEDIEDDEDEVKDKFVKTPSNDSDDEDETKITDKAKGDEDEEMDYTTSQLYDDVDIRLNEPVDTDKGWLMTLTSSAEKPSKTFDELMSTPIDFSAFIMNCLKINNLTQETLLGPAFRLLKGTHSNYVELEYDFEECYKALSEKLDWENPEGGDYL
ncbi:hypothetical protein Tco_1289835 [Tanacetum coccineum]